MELTWKWGFAWQILPTLLEATLATIVATFIGFFIAVFLGLAFALMQRTPFRTLTVAVREFVELVRSTPLLVQIYFIFFVAPQVGINLTPWVAGLLAIGLYRAAYLSEVYRGGLDAVPTGQWEACMALSLPTSKTYLRVILPQALPPALAGMGNTLIATFKDTPMLFAIGVFELLHSATVVGSESYRYLEPYTIVGLIFLAISLPTAWLLRAFEQWVRKNLGMK